MNHRQIHSLEEDFAMLGVLPQSDGHGADSPLAEMGDEPGAPGKPDPKAAQLQKKKLMIQKKQLVMQKQAEGIELDAEELALLEMDLGDGNDLEESFVKTKRLRGVAKIKSRIRARKYTKKHRAQLKRVRKSKRYKMMAKKRTKFGKARKGFRRVFAWSKKAAANESTAMANLAGVVQSLGQDKNTSEMQQGYLNVHRIANALSESYNELAEEFVCSNVNYGDVADALKGISAEAMIYAEAIERHDESLPTTDVELLSNHSSGLVEELANLLDLYHDHTSAIALDEGDGAGTDGDSIWNDDEDLDIEPEEGLEEGQAHGEHSMAPVEGWGNEPNESTFSVMHPLGISRAGHAEKLILQGQLKRETTEDLDGDMSDLLGE